jgi:hypothetical protein
MARAANQLITLCQFTVAGECLFDALGLAGA